MPINIHNLFFSPVKHLQIQIYDEAGEAFHFAQTEVEEDGSYEYKFRVRNVNDGQVINIFEGDYFVKIFKVVYLESNFDQV